VANLPAGVAKRPAPAVVPKGARLVMFGGKGGVGKTTCATAVALVAAGALPRKRVLLLSTDPAHSLGDALGVPVSDAARRIPKGPPNLLVRELDAARIFDEVRGQVTSAIERLFDSGPLAGVGTTVDVAGHDRQVMRDLLELAPPGVDELVAIMEVTESLTAAVEPPCDLIVMDTAPTGHALRLLEMPSLVHDWVKALMAIVLKYQAVVGLGELGSTLLRVSQGLGRLRSLLGDPGRARFVAVTRLGILPRAETVRLLARLKAAGISAPMVIVNAAGAGTCPRCRVDAARQAKELAALNTDLKRARTRPDVLIAPAEMPPPHGTERLRAWWGRTVNSQRPTPDSQGEWIEQSG
ncbi:MAG: ArsA family ATPase, partial [Vicinamibacterales bacterium]